MLPDHTVSGYYLLLILDFSKYKYCREIGISDIEAAHHLTRKHRFLFDSS